MYSVVLVAAMATAPATPDWCFKHGGCYGNTSCCGGGWGYGGCCGGGWGYGGCHGSGWGCGGCCGGGGWGCHGVTSAGFCGFCGGGYPAAPYASLAFSGCCGGHGAYYTGCMGYGAYATPVAPPGYGYGYGGYVGGATVVPGGGFTIEGGTPATGGSGSAGSGATGGTGGSRGTGGSGGTGGAGSPGGGGAGGPGGISAPGTPVPVVTVPVNRGQVVVLAPATAKLFAEGEATSLTGPERVFLTPELSAGRDFQYTLKLENGTESTTKQITVRAGHRTVVDFNGAVERVTTPVTVNLPSKAKLFVDGVPAAVAGGTHTFRTPELAKGKAFTYEFRAEVDKNGTTETVSKKVTFTAGEPVTVDFVEPAAVRTALK